MPKPLYTYPRRVAREENEMDAYTESADGLGVFGENLRGILTELIFKRVKVLGTKVLPARSHQPATAGCEGIFKKF